MRFVLAVSSCLFLLLTGCALTSTESPVPNRGLAFSGKTYGGQQPIVGAKVYLLAANTTGYGGNGIAPSSLNASASLLTAATGNSADSIGFYVITGAGGTFSISGDYTCTAGQQLYLYSVGGDPGAGINSAAALMAALGDCSSINGSTFVFMNEVSTVAAAYAFAGFATDATHVSSSGTALALKGIANAFASSTNLETLATGVALATTPAGNGNVPQQEINSLANILAACLNTSSSSSSNCTTLLTTATSDGTPSGTQPTDVATAAINIAHNPGANMTALYGITAPQPPFAPALSAQPNDWTIVLHYNATPQAYGYAAIDASGNVWVLNSDNTLGKYSPLGVVLSGPSGFTGGNLSSPFIIAIDASGDAWVSNNGNDTLTEFNSAGTQIATASGGGMVAPAGIAIDATGNLWVGNFGGSYNSISKFDSSGNPISSSSGYTGGGVAAPYGTIGVDAGGNVWVSNLFTNSVSKFDSSGTPLSGSGYTGGGVNTPYSLAIDAAGNAWVANHGSNTLSKFSPTGSPLSGSGYTGGGLADTYSVAFDGAGNVWAGIIGGDDNAIAELTSSGTPVTGPKGYIGAYVNTPHWLAIDGSGNLWTATPGLFGLNEYVGVAAPVVTPMVANLLPPYTHPASLP